MFKHVLFFEKSWGQGRCFCTTHVWAALQGQDCCVHSACGTDVAFCHGNAASGQGEDGSDFVLANIDSKQ